MESLSIIATPGIATASPSYRAHCVESKSMARSAFISGTPLHLQYPFCPLYSASRSVRAFNTAAAILSQIEEVEKEGSPKEAPNPLTPTSFEIQSLLMEVCDETSIAELELKVGAFKLHVKRDVAKLKGSAPPVPVAPPVPSKPMVESVTANISPPVVAASATKTSLLSVAEILANPASKSGSRFGLLEAAADEGLLFVTSPKVGLFRRSRVVKGKSGRPLCEEGQNVKEGQVVCYVEQLGTQQPVEAENTGEVMKILCEDGEPVGYGDPLIAIRPSFPGIK